MITPANFAIFVTNVNTMVGEAYGTTPTIHPLISTTLPTSSLTWETGWTGMLDQMRPWYGARVTKEAAPQTYSVTVIPFELTLTLDRFRLDDDMYGIYYRQIPDMARQAKRWPDYQIRNLLENAAPWTGAAQNGFDGLTAFNTAHYINYYNTSLGTYCNDFTGGGVVVTYPKPGGGNVTTLVGGAFTGPAFSTLLEYTATVKGEDNEALGIVVDRLLHAPILRTEVDLVLKSQFFAPPAWGTITGQVGAADNPLRRMGVEPIENPLLNNGYTWYLLDTNKALKPFLWIEREPVRFTPRVNEDDPILFDTHAYTWGQWARGAPAWNYSWLFYRSGP
jgi:phage major head subunit gpT-like protein